MKLVARTFSGLETILDQELKELGISNTKITRRAVEFEGDLSTLYNVNIHSRLALDVLQPIYKFYARSADELYGSLRKINWEKYMNENDTFFITPIIHSPYFTHSQYAILKAKDAIVDHFRSKTGIRPNIDKKNPNLRLVLRISNDKCEILLNSSGNPLFKRGYRKSTHEAPLNEVLASALVQLSNWDEKKPLIDPMCGSGTILIEAALLANKIAPGLLGRAYGFQKWKNYDNTLFNDLISDAQKIVTQSNVEIIGNDISPSTIEMAKENAYGIPLIQGQIEFLQQNFLKSKKPVETGCIITNPPYDKRISLGNVDDFYNNIGTRLKHFYTGFDAWILTANLPAIKKIGLKTSSKHQLFNGPDECRFLQYSLYQGSKKK